MRDISEKDRKDFEVKLFSTLFHDKYDFWSFLRHHDIFGCLCTGEASLPSIFEMARWTGPEIDNPLMNRGLSAYICYLAMINIADSDSSLFFNKNTSHIGLPTIEAKRYLDDWKKINNYLSEEVTWEGKHIRREKCLKREEFRNWLLDISSHPEYTISRIARIVITAYRMCLPEEDLSDTEVERLVEDELQMLHGARLESFCYRFTRFCKIDYGLRFFQVLMIHELLEKGENLVKRQKPSEPDYEFPLAIILNASLSRDKQKERKQKSVSRMANRTCQILKRIIDDYGYLVVGEQKSSPLLCVVMAGLMPENERNTAWALCKALKKNSSRALGWIADEIGVGLYGE